MAALLIKLRRQWQWLLLAGTLAGMLAALAVAGCSTVQPLTAARARLLKLPATQLAPFTEEDVLRVIDSLQHLRHVQARTACRDCHLEKLMLPAQDTERSCRLCHEARTVDDRIWKHHCSSCHPFNARAELSSGTFSGLAEKCAQCHAPEEGESAFGACSAPREPEKACKSCHDIHSGATRTGPPEAYEFSADDQQRIISNTLHQKHRKAEVQCLSCHREGKELSAADATERCSDCHPQSIVAKEVWHEHCLACHAFTTTDEHALGTPRVAQRLCEGCHSEAGAESSIYGFCQPGSTHNITCQRCHQPHKSAIVAGEDVCASCHEDIVGKTHPSKKVHGACIMCHSPHKARKDWSDTCNTCHLANQTVLVHRIPGHPEDCLACHSPHFTEVEILGDACLNCHQGMFYTGSRRQSQQHRSCENCHDIASFKYNGDGSCAKCHKEQGRILGDKRLNAQHRYCITCHKPHTWRASFETSCEVCHETELVIEHRMPFHQLPCRECHDAHGTATLARSGDCNGCHAQQQIPAFKANTPDEHVTCANCHPADAVETQNFSFNGAEGSCRICHPLAAQEPQLEWSSVPSGHLMCTGCHSAHTFKAKPGVDSCGKCHADVFAVPPKEQHADCYNCHQLGHDSRFSGEALTCAVCHPEAFERAGGGVKQQCSTCHSPHEFKADPASCGICHADVQQEAQAAQHGDCSLCHADHNWRPGGGNCSICHPQLGGEHKALSHGDCLNCHQVHSMRAGSTSCGICHPQPPLTCTSDNCIECHTFRTRMATL